jgi:hypothetical protein
MKMEDGRVRKLVFCWICVFLAVPCGARIITVDDDGPADFNNIQAAIDDANDGDTIVVKKGLYVESINFLGKSIAVRSTNPGNLRVVSETVIGADSWEGEVVVQFRGTEGPSCLLAGFEINGGVVGFDLVYGTEHTSATIARCIFRGNRSGRVMHGCDGLIRNCLVAGNTDYTATTDVKATIEECCGVIRNCTIADNNGTYGIRVSSLNPGCYLRIENCIVYGNQLGQVSVVESAVDVCFSDIQGGPEGVELLDGSLNWGAGNIDADPWFVMLGRWDANDTPADLTDDFWLTGDYHLKSEGWRFDMNFDPPRWGYDYVTSRCIDAGNPGSALRRELLTIPGDPGHIWGENLRMNMGAYGGTRQASMPPYDWALLADITNDGIVDGRDFAHQASDWLINGTGQPGDFDRNGVVDTNDVGLFVDDWLKTTSWHE